MPPAITKSVDQDHVFENRSTSYAKQSDTNLHLSEDQAEGTNAAPWRGLFLFTTRSNLPVLVAGLIASLISGAVSPAQSFITGRFFDKLIAYAAGTLQREQFANQEKKYIFYLLIVAGVAWISLYAELALWIAFGELQAKSARDRLFHGLLKRDIEWYDLRKHGIGALLPRLQTQIRALQLATSQPLGVIVGTSSTAILSLIQAFVLSWKLTLVTLSTTPVVMLAVIWVGTGMQNAFDNQNELLSEAQKFAINAFTAIETVKCFNAQSVEQKKYTTCIARAATWYFRAVQRNSLQIALVTLLSVSMFVQGFYYGGVLIAKGEISTANVITTFMSAIAAFQAINAVLPSLIVLEKGRNAGSTLRTVMAEIQRDPMDIGMKGTLKPTTCHGAIQVKYLTFSYPSRPQQPALRDVSMFIPAGETTFIIGRSGSGKSTLGQLLVRFYYSRHGKILLDGNDLDSLDTHWLRKNITLVEQTSSLFNNTIYENIAFGKDDPGCATKDEVVRAAEFALLQSLIYDLPDGIETMVGYKGSAMSGGQRQRVALARARLRDSPVLILDESTSALDRISRSLMMEAIRKWRRHKTTIIVTHDISQIRADDYMYILEDGKLVQEGCRKRLERLEGTPFQSFLPDVKRRRTANDSELRDGCSDSVQTGSSGPDADNTDRESILSDPLETRFMASENKRASILPSIFPDGSPLPGLRTKTLSPWTRFGFVSPSESAPIRLRPGWIMKRQEFDLVRKDQATDGDNRISTMLESLIHRTGAMAAESRMNADGRPRDRAVGLEMESKRNGVIEGSRALPIRKFAHGIEAQARVKTLRQILSTLWPSVDWSTKAVLVLGFTCATLSAISTPVFSFVLSKMLKLYSIPGGDKQKSLVYAMAILAIAVIDSLCTYTYHFCFEYAGQHWVNRIRSKAVERILDQPRAFFEQEENAVSRLADGLDRNAEEMRNLLGRFSAIVWMATLMSGVSIIWALVAQWKMALIAIATGPYILGVAKAFGAVSQKWETLSNDAAEDAAAIFTETFTNIKTVRALTLEQHFVDNYIKVTNKALAVGFRRAFFSGFFFGLSDSAGSFSIAMIYYVGAKLVTNGVPPSHIIEVFVFLVFTILNLDGMLVLIPQITASKDMASRLLRLAHLPKDSHEHLGHTQVLDVGDIVFNDTQFSYPSRLEQTVLKHFNMHIGTGICTAIVGASGSGKSTIANLLLNLYCTSGNGRVGSNDLTIAGRNIKRIDTATLRTLIVPVSQTPTLFSATVFENIAYGLPLSSPHYNFASISAAASKAGIHDFINSLPQGYGTAIGDGGIGVSGGQAQRIAIARALVRNPAVLILDEATSALDVESAEQVRQTITQLVRDPDRGMTVIIITHNREMMEIAENVVVLENGSVVEEGSFDSLLARRAGALVNLLNAGQWVSEDSERYQ